MIVPLRHRRLWHGIGAMLIALVVYLSLTPRPVHLPLGGDKLAHLAAYATLTIWFSWTSTQSSSRLQWAAAFVAMGIGLECLQGLGGDRSFEAADIAANVFGVGLGWLAGSPRLPNALAILERRLPWQPKPRRRPTWRATTRPQSRRR